MNASGVTLFGEHGFVLGREAFESNKGPAKTVLHKPYRRETPASAGGVSGRLASVETKPASRFAHDYY